MVHRREVDGEEIVLGNQGALWRGALTFFDHETRSVWSQPLGLAISGPLKGTELELLPATLTTWSDWYANHPSSLALDAPAQPADLDVEATVVVVRLGDQAVGYPLPDIVEAGVINGTVGGHEIAVVAQSQGLTSWVVYSRQVGNAVPALELVGNHLVDLKTGAAWNAMSGSPAGSTAGMPALVPLPGVPVYNDDLRRLWPGVLIHDGSPPGRP